MRYPASLTVPITVTRDTGSPLHQQIAAQLASAVEGGLLSGRQRLPSTRMLADALGVSRGVTAAAYELLFARGYLVGERGSGTYVDRPADEHGSGAHVDRPADWVTASVPAPPPAATEVVDMRPGLLSNEAFPLTAWRSAWRQAGYGRPPAGRLPALGLPELRRAVAEHLISTRGTPLAGRQVVITSGIPHALRLVLDALGLSGSQVAIEEPTAPPVHQLLRGHRASPPVALAVDTDGAVVGDAASGCRALVVHSDASVPFGHRLSADRCEAALDAGRHLIEVTSALPGPARAGRPTGSLLIGDFGELFGPSLNLGYALLPQCVADIVGRLIVERGEQPPFVTQLAMEALLRDGTTRRLAHRLEQQYAGKTELVRSALPVHAERGTAVALLDGGANAAHAAAELLDHGVRVSTLRPYYFSGRTVPDGLVFGYGHLPDAALQRVLPVLNRMLTHASPALAR